MNKQASLLYIDNFLEDIYDTFVTLDEDTRKELQNQYKCYNDQQILSVLAEHQNKQKYYFIFSSQSSRPFIEYACSFFQLNPQKVQVLVPKKESQKYIGSISTYIMEDQHLMNRLKSQNNLELLSFSITDQYLQLCDILKTSARPLQPIKKQDWPTIKRLGTKAGIRELLQQIKDPKIFLPPGKVIYIQKNTRQQIILQIVKKLKTQSVVIKTQKHFSGKGVQIIKKTQVQGLSQDQICNLVKSRLKEKFWWEFDLVIQDFIDLDNSYGPPCVQIYINNDGNVSLLWQTAMFIANQKQFQGVFCGYSTFTQEIANKLSYCCLTLGKIYSNVGYRGYINLDFLIDKNGTIYLAQSNVRRSGSVYIHNFANQIVGKQYYKNNYVINHWLYSQGLANIKFEDLLKQVKKIDLDYRQQKGQGIVLSSSQVCFTGEMLLFFAIAPTKQEGFKMKQQVKQLLGLTHNISWIS